MSPATEQVYRNALALADDERAVLLDALLAVDEPGDTPPLDESWREVIASRSAELDAGTVTAVPWEEVRDKARRRVGLDG